MIKWRIYREANEKLPNMKGWDMFVVNIGWAGPEGYDDIEDWDEASRAWDKFIEDNDLPMCVGICAPEGKDAGIKQMLEKQYGFPVENFDIDRSEGAMEFQTLWIVWSPNGWKEIDADYENISKATGKRGKSSIKGDVSNGSEVKKLITGFEKVFKKIDENIENYVEHEWGMKRAQLNLIVDEVFDNLTGMGFSFRNLKHAHGIGNNNEWKIVNDDDKAIGRFWCTDDMFGGIVTGVIIDVGLPFGRKWEIDKSGVKRKDQ